MPNLQSGGKTAGKGLIMRAKSQWTPGGIVLWLIAAILATLVVCLGAEPESAEPTLGRDRPIELEVEVVE